MWCIVNRVVTKQASLKSNTLGDNQPSPLDYAKSFRNTSRKEAEIPKSVQSVVSLAIRESIDVEVYGFTNQECMGK